MEDIIQTTPAEVISIDNRSSSQTVPFRIRSGTKAIVSASDKVLLLKEQHASGSTFWTLPGGGIEPSESLLEGLTRELFEELRCQSLIREPVGTVWYAHLSRRNTFSTYAVFECSLLSTPLPSKQEGILDHQWVSPANLPSSTLPQVRYLLRSEVNH
ncbi:NUDIX hydrolase [Halalkalicoccus tibetensis]|uniref:NUDIX hydrolase n=1 Tax=Halalkalicoccus tibetensis TaxID=175632 RepID=A0ABD5V884_9EURY